jgi:hypothetical protein
MVVIVAVGFSLSIGLLVVVTAPDGRLGQFPVFFNFQVPRLSHYPIYSVYRGFSNVYVRCVGFLCLRWY